jgi:hypothetical protein
MSPAGEKQDIRWIQRLNNYQKAFGQNKTSHTYNKETAEEICRAVISVYFPLFRQLREKMSLLAIDPDQT